MECNGNNQAATEEALVENDNCFSQLDLSPFTIAVLYHWRRRLPESRFPSSIYKLQPRHVHLTRWQFPYWSSISFNPINLFKSTANIYSAVVKTVFCECYCKKESAAQMERLVHPWKKTLYGDNKDDNNKELVKAIRSSIKKTRQELLEFCQDIRLSHHSLITSSAAPNNRIEERVTLHDSNINAPHEKEVKACPLHMTSRCLSVDNKKRKRREGIFEGNFLFRDSKFSTKKQAIESETIVTSSFMYSIDKNVSYCIDELVMKILNSYSESLGNECVEDTNNKFESLVVLIRGFKGKNLLERMEGHELE